MRLVGAEEPEECYQLLYCHLAATGAAVPDQQAEALRRVVTAQPGRYQAAHLAGKAGKVCEARYKCRIQAEDIVQAACINIDISSREGNKELDPRTVYFYRFHKFILGYRY